MRSTHENDRHGQWTTLAGLLALASGCFGEAAEDVLEIGADARVEAGGNTTPALVSGLRVARIAERARVGIVYGGLDEPLVLGAASIVTGYVLSTMQTLSEISYTFHLSPALALASLSFAVLIGYAGGLLPALRAAQMPIVNAVRAD